MAHPAWPARTFKEFVAELHQLTSKCIEEHAQRGDFSRWVALRLLKIGAQIRITARKVWISMASSFPMQAVFAQAWQQLRC